MRFIIIRVTRSIVRSAVSMKLLLFGISLQCEFNCGGVSQARSIINSKYAGHVPRALPPPSPPAALNNLAICNNSKSRTKSLAVALQFCAPAGCIATATPNVVALHHVLPSK
ncbi:hypothetical protein TcasGA2_TC002782 [Tribolium castaneum]|uniref:Uncharacterized protein n=1 Tax=Tribolium castaneum TaxID=7070 RepID=D6WIP7_TRICA|nr:hypothetical protein TcasGA2_TC002782 [Tribolium castaneum]